MPQELARPSERVLAELLPAAVGRRRSPRFQVVLGPRRVGKTTVMYQALQRMIAGGADPRGLVWLRLDHPTLGASDLGSLVRAALEAGGPGRRPLTLFLDELTYAGDWDLWLKTFYDERWAVRVVASSSSSAALRRRRAESGVGRWEEQHLPPYLFGEYLALRGVDAGVTLSESLAGTLEAVAGGGGPSPELSAHRRRYLLVGGFTDLLVAEAPDEASDVLHSQRVLRADAVQATLYRDIPQAFGVGEPVKLERLLYTLAGQACGLLSPLSVAGSVGLSQPTTDAYIRYLEQAFLIFTLPNYAPREETVQRRGRKLYFCDGAVRNAALQRGIAPTRDPVEMGLLLKNAAAAHLHSLAQQRGARLYHWRSGRVEVDLVYEEAGTVLAFEIASSASHGTAGLDELQERDARFRSRTYLVCPDVAPAPAASDGGPGRLPFDLFLACVSAQTEKSLRLRMGE